MTSPSGYLLDTVLPSELVKRNADAAVLAWVDAQDDSNLFISAITLGELQKGISRLVMGEKRRMLQAWLEQDLVHRFHGRVLPVDSAVAVAWGALLAEAGQRGEPLPVVDGLIAATAKVHTLTVVTRNVRDLQRCGVPVHNPWSS